jgi:hypothetical protein
MQKRLLARIPILLLLLCVGSTLTAQRKTITGRVTDAKDGSPLSGVTVLPKGDTKNGTTTANDGTFTLNVAPGTRFLTFSSVGYVSQDQAIGTGPFHISLTAGSSGLNEIVVIGYGTAKKKDLTGAVAVVDEKDFQKGTITTPEQMIAGKVPGVSIISNRAPAAPSASVAGLPLAPATARSSSWTGFRSTTMCNPVRPVPSPAPAAP